MPTLTIEYQTEAERLILERAIAYASGIRRLAVTAPRICIHLQLPTGSAANRCRARSRRAGSARLKRRSSKWSEERLLCRRTTQFNSDGASVS